MRPYHLLLFLVIVGVLSLGLSAVWPQEGVKMTHEWTLKFPTIDQLFAEDTTSTVNVDSLLASYEVDSAAIRDSLRKAEIAYRQKMLRIQYKDSSAGLFRFFDDLQNREKGAGKVDILHYGDSQIEGDRITSIVRNLLQKRFGGTGAGYIAASPLVSHFSIKNTRSANWQRHPIFGKKDSTLIHNRFGMYGVFCRFTDFPAYDTIPADTVRRRISKNIDGQEYSVDTSYIRPEVVQKTLPNDSLVKAWVELKPSGMGYYRSGKFTKLRLMFSNPDAAFTLKVVLSDSTKTQSVYQANSGAREYIQSFPEAQEAVRLEFSTKSSPDVYGIRLENDYGIVMDNIAMRGSSGTFFGRNGYNEMATQMRNISPDLIILQFGGNVVPHMENEERAARYGRWFASQIRLLQRINPDADFVLIGPSDMSMKEGTQYVTNPMVPVVRDVLKKAAFETGCGYWDLYEVMGGRNSMKAWVEADPPLAAKDYVHFTQRGARKAGELFYDALMKDYEDWKQVQ